MGGDIALSLEREPAYFTYSGVDGPFHQVVIARELGEEKIAGMASRSIRPVYCNGSVRQLGYLGQLRFALPHRRFFPLQQGFRYLRELHGDGRTPFYLTSIMEDNLAAHRILQSGVAGLPCYREYCRFTTFTIAARSRRKTNRTSGAVRVETGSAGRVSQLIDFLQQNGRKMQFAPVWDAGSLFHPASTPGLCIDDFLLAMEGEKIVGCMALWDQRPFKQAVIRSYPKHLARWRALINLVAALRGAPELPPVNGILPHCYLSHIAISDLRSEVFGILLESALDKARRAKIPLVTVGFADRHPFTPFLEGSYRAFKSISRIFLVFWNDHDQPESPVIEKLTPGLEVAIL